MKVMVVGCGDVGGATADVLEDYHGDGQVLRHDPAVEQRVRRGIASECDVVIFCIDTPSGPDGMLSIKALRDAVIEWAEKLAVDRVPAFVVRSTVPVGTCVELSRLAERPVLHWPEFGEHNVLREWIHAPPFAVVGGPSEEVIDQFIMGCLPWYVGLAQENASKIFKRPTNVSELTKLATNVLYAGTVVMANELARLGAVDGVEWEQSITPGGEQAWNVRSVIIMIISY